MDNAERDLQAAREHLESMKATSKRLFKENIRLKKRIDRVQILISKAKVAVIWELPIGTTVHYPGYPMWGKEMILGGATGKIYKRGHKYLYVDFGKKIGKWRLDPKDIAEGPGKVDEAAKKASAIVGGMAQRIFNTTGG